jgi:hypothetical protein
LLWMQYVNVSTTLPRRQNKVGSSRWSLTVGLAFEVNAGACDTYLREYINPLKFLNSVKGGVSSSCVPLTPSGVDVEGTPFPARLG